MEEILEHVYHEIRMSNYDKKLIGGIVLTGGGSQLKHLTQLVEYITGMDARIGYPAEHLVRGEVGEINNPIYATGVGLIIKGFQSEDRDNSVAQPIGSKKRKAAVLQGQGIGRIFSGFWENTRQFFEDDQAEEFNK